MTASRIAMAVEPRVKSVTRLARLSIQQPLKRARVNKGLRHVTIRHKNACSSQVALSSFRAGAVKRRKAMMSRTSNVGG